VITDSKQIGELADFASDLNRVRDGFPNWLVASSEPGCSRNQHQSCPGDNEPDRLRDVLAGGCETFGGDSGRRGSHCPQVHDPDNEQYGCQVGTTEDAVKSETYALSPSRAGVGR
jgi:hypothetical protein